MPEKLVLKNYNPTFLQKSNRKKRVGIYCRVSSNLPKQLNSMANQLSELVRKVYVQNEWVLVDVYADFHSGDSVSHRPQFLRMMDDCRNGKLDIILSKSVSRFGRDAIDTDSSVHELLGLGISVIFDEENIDSKTPDGELVISVLAALAQEENLSRHEDHIWGIKRQLEDGTSKLYNRPCYGYKNDEDGNLQIDDAKAAVVRDIFQMYLSGMSILKIQRELNLRQIPSPTGKEKWCKRSIDTMLSNEKYIGNAEVFKTYTERTPERKRRINRNGSHTTYVSIDNNPAIITPEVFEAVQAEKARRSNIETGPNGTHRKNTMFLSKPDAKTDDPSGKPD